MKTFYTLVIIVAIMLNFIGEYYGLIIIIYHIFVGFPSIKICWTYSALYRNCYFFRMLLGVLNFGRMDTSIFSKLSSSLPNMSRNLFSVYFLGSPSLLLSCSSSIQKKIFHLNINHFKNYIESFYLKFFNIVRREFISILNITQSYYLMRNLKSHLLFNTDLKLHLFFNICYYI